MVASLLPSSCLTYSDGGHDKSYHGGDVIFFASLNPLKDKINHLLWATYQDDFAKLLLVFALEGSLDALVVDLIVVDFVPGGVADTPCQFLRLIPLTQEAGWVPQTILLLLLGVPLLFVLGDNVEDFEVEKVVVDTVCCGHNHVAQLHIDNVVVGGAWRVLANQLSISSQHVFEVDNLFDFALLTFMFDLGL